MRLSTIPHSDSPVAAAAPAARTRTRAGKRIKQKQLQKQEQGQVQTQEPKNNNNKEQNKNGSVACILRFALSVADTAIRDYRRGCKSFGAVRERL